jgi:replicative DNA helicase
MPPDLKSSGGRRATAAVIAQVLDRLPPHSPEAEEGILGCIMLSPNDCLGECIEKLKGGASVFYDLRHQTIYGMMIEMYDKREAVDVITLQQRLKDKQILEQVGGISYLAMLPDKVPSAANLIYYVDIVIEKYILRRIIRTCTDVANRVHEHEGDVEILLDEVERDILGIGESQVEGTTAKIKDLVKKAIKSAKLRWP